MSRLIKLEGRSMSLRKVFTRLCVVALIASQATVLLGVTSASATTDNSPMTLTINTAATGCSGLTVTLPLNGTVSATVDWGDGTTAQSITTANPTYTYTAGGMYTISITGSATGFGSTTGFCQLTGVTSWGTTTTGTTGLTSLTSLAGAFNQDTNLTVVPTDFPAAVTDMSSMFSGAAAFNQNISSWDTAAVTDMSSMFAGATAFNNGGAPLATTTGGWDTTAVTNMYAMFFAAAAFNQNISSWNTAAVTNMGDMFINVTAFNQSLGTWAVANVTDMTDMLNGTALSVVNYDATLVGWASQTVKSGVPLGTSGLAYDTTGATARNTLTSSPDSWTITGDGVNDIITFDSEGGSSVANVNGADGTTVTLPGAPTYTGHTFVGWFAAASGGAALTSPYTLSGSVTLYAQWVVDITITFNANGGTGAAIPEYALSGSGVGLTTNTATFTGYTFAGWNTAANGLGVDYADRGYAQFAADVTLYAQWISNTSPWSALTVGEPGNIGFSAVSCTSTTFCVAVDYNSNALIYNGTTWSAQSSIDSGGSGFVSVSCTSTTFCMAVDYNGNALIYNGTTWSTTSIDGVSTLTAVSCTSSTFCVAVDNKGNALTYNGTTWSTPTSIDSAGGGFGAVSCTSSTFCMAVDNNGNALSYNGTTWSTPASIDGPTNYLDAVSCTSTTFCVAVDGFGRAFSYDGTSWSTPTSVESAAVGFSAVSCASTTFCMAVDWDSNASIYSPHYTVTFEGNGSTGGATSPEINNTATPLTTNTLTKSGYTFTGWNTLADGTGTTYADGASYPFAASTTLFAQWTANTYTVTFNNNTGSGSITSETKSTTTNLTTNAFTKTGYTFTGWNTLADGTGTTYADGASYPFAASTTLFAQWTVVTVTPPTHPRPPTVVPPTTRPTNAPPPKVLPASDYGTPTSASASSTAAVQISQSGGTTNAKVSVPAGALVSGTTVSVYGVTDTTTLVSQIPSGQSYVTAVAVSWQSPDGSATIATTPITITMSNSNIKTGDTIYEETTSGLKFVGTSATNGSASVTFSTDPTFVIAHTNLLAQSTLTLTSATGTLGQTIALTISGGSGSGAVSYAVANGTATGCTIIGSSLSATRAGTCLVTATKAADTNDSAASSLATTVTFRVALKATRATSPVWRGKSVVTNILGAGFYGRPRITSNVGGTRIGVLHDNGTRLTIRATVGNNAPRGVHTFRIVFAKGQSITVRYNQR